jgi:hypothetical protein
MDQQDILVGGRLGLDEVRRFRNAGGKQPIVNQPILLRWKYVLPNREIIAVAVNQPKRKHESSKREVRRTKFDLRIAVCDSRLVNEQENRKGYALSEE